MKHLLPFIFFTLFASHVIHAQNTDTAFAKQWHIIDSLIVTADKPKTALAKVNGIYREAKQKKLDPQVIRALLYRLSLQEKNTETGIDSTMNVLSKEISAATNVLQKSVLQALAAAVLHSYFNDVYWQIRYRSNTKGYTKENIETWSAADFLTAIDSLYNQALKPAGVLQQTPVEQYGAVVIDGFNTEHLRPSMYDLLANMAIEFYTNDNDKQTKLQNAFALNDTNTLAPAIVFAGTRFNTADTSSFLFKTIKLYQQILQFHIAAGDTAALLDADINRIAWVYNNAAFSNKTVYYKKALSAVTEKYPAHPHAAQAWYLLLKLQYDGADKYNPFGDTTHHYDLVNIRQQLIQRLAIQPGESEGKANMQALLQQIDAKQLSTKAEAVNMPGTPFRVLVTYKNVDTLYGRILSKSAVANLNKSNDSAFWASLAKLPYSKYFAQPLPHVTDYRQHSVEIKMDALPAGRYVLFAASGKNFAGDSTTRLLTQDIAVSHLAYIHNGNNYYVLDREGGQPLPGVKVKAAIHYYNTNSMKWEDMLLYSGTTNKQGYFSLDSKTKKFAYGSISITLTDGADVLESTGNNTIYYNSITNAPSLAPATFEKNNARASLYTDRGIYRPGQKVLFKAIAVTKDAVTGLSKLYLAKDSLTFYLINVNEENIDSARLPVNTYGSVAGSFTLPAHGLTGSFSIAVKEIEGRQYFRVEEYKRPTFYVQLDTLGDAYRLKDTVTVTGFAQAFAGNYLNGATVKYNVTRKTRYKVYDWNYNRHPQNNNSRQIAEGAVTTGGDGRFSIQFPALADETMDSTGNPVFDFDISVSVTDAGGETREAQAAFAAGYTSAIVKLDAPAIAEKNSVPEIPVTVQNLSGKTVVALVHLKIYPLQVPGRVVRERYWERPDTYVMTEDAFIKAFPYDEYQNESNKHTWQHGAAVINDSLLTGGSTAFSIPHTQLQPGWYMIEASAKDKTGHIITDTAYTEVYDAGSNALPAKDNNFTAASKTVLHPGEEASLLVGSAYKEVYAYVKTGRFKRKAAAATGMQLIKLNDDKQVIGAAVTAGDKGGLGIYYAFIKHNRYYSGGQVFNVPYDDKTLTVKYTS
ncbi:MAG TPA: MG2 domain-containing protein, partial [Chitinophagaceae bacterium]|nr:MG2 domain-containing protein [Chitinophagaceae bacterium]